MLDWFVILTPLLVLGVIALLGFVGCDNIFGIHTTGVLPSLQLATLQPTQGATLGGTQVMLSGEGFASAGINQVTFGGVSATSITVMSDTQIQATSPPHLAGAVDVIASAPYDSTNPLTYTYVVITFVQMQANSTAFGSSIQVTLPSPTTAGNILIAAVSYVGAGSITVTDNSGHAFTSVGKHAWYQGQAEMFYLASPGGAVTVKATGPSGQWNICVSEYTGGLKLGAVIGNSSRSTGPVATENISGVAVAPAASNLVYVVVFTVQGSNPNLVVGSGGGFTGHSFAPDAAVLAEDTMSAVTSGEIVATATPTGSFLPWVVLAAEIQT